ncbi:LysM peptidoglycan-binding domain-containing protein [Streptomyces sp. NPDC004050]
MPKPTPTATPPTRRKSTPPSRRNSGAQTAATLVCGLLALMVLSALLAGLPALLWWATSIVGPPGLAALSSLLTTDDSGQVFLLALACVGWVGWACFVCAVLLEIPAQVRGRAAPQIRGLVGQRAAAALVAAVLLALPTGTALAAPSPAQAATTLQTTASASPVPGTGSTHTAAAADASQTTAVTHTVRDAKPAESLWSIAAERLGDGERWGDIATLNDGHTMNDGHTFHTDRPIQPGWVLRLPDDARPAPAPATPGAGPGPQQTGSAAAATYTVKEGDSLSRIAEKELGNADRYGEIFHLNQGRALPGGGTFTDPDLIHPGQQLALPPTDTAVPAPTRDTRPDARDAGPTTPAPDAKPKPAPSPTTATTTPAPATTLAPAATTTHGPSASAPAPAPAPASASALPSTADQTPQPAPPVTAHPAQDTADKGINIALIAGIGTLLAASLASALGVRRILQQRQRRAGQTIAQDHEPTKLEQILSATCEPAGIDLLDRALRTLAHHAINSSQTLPALRGVRLDSNGVSLLLDEPGSPPVTPFTTGPTPHVWALDAKAELLTAEQLTDIQAPYPGLVTLGATTDDVLVLIDLMASRVLLLDGEDEEVLEVARAIALELGTSAWTDYSEILTTGLGARLAGLLPSGRIRTMPHLPAVAADLGELMLEAHQSGEQVLPWLVVGAGTMDEEHVVQLADALAAARTLNTGVVLPASAATRRYFPHAEILTVSRAQHASVAFLDTDVELQRINDEQYRQYVHALKVSTQEAEAATYPWERAEDHDQPAASGTPLTVHTTENGTLDPGDPFPALLTGRAPTTAATDTDADTTSNPGNQAGSSTTDSTTGQATHAPTSDAAGRTAHDAGRAPLPKQTTRDEDNAVAVRIELLGPLRIHGGHNTAHNPRTASLAALIHLRPGRTSDYLCQAMDPASPWTTRTLHSRLSELRNVLGLHTDAQPLLPRPKTGDGYRFHPAVTSDWDTFQNLATRGLAAGPLAGIEDLEAAMALVRGKPFDGRTPPWADPIVQDILSRITDTAHTLARWQTDGIQPDLDAARHTIHKALDVEETSEVLYRDLLTIEWKAGNDTATRRTITRLQHMARTYDITLDDTTEDTINRVLTSKPASTEALTIKI